MSDKNCKICLTVPVNILTLFDTEKATNGRRPGRKFLKDLGYLIHSADVVQHRKHLGQYEPYAKAGTVESVVEPLEAFVDGAEDKTTDWFQERGIDLPPGFKGATITVKTDDGEKAWIRATPEQTTPEIEDEYRELIQHVRDWKPAPLNTTGNGEPVSFFMGLADLQLGKREGGGTEATKLRFIRHLNSAIERLRSLISQGANVTEVVIWQGGDPVEGCSIGSTLFELDTNQRFQLKLAIELLASAIRNMADVVPSVRFVTVHSNHGQWTRQGGKKPVTDPSDTADGHIADVLQMVFSDSPNISFVTPQAEPVVAFETNGVKIASAHGHEATPASMEKWLDDQSRVLVYELDFKPHLWITAHSHHFRAVDLGSYHWFQCPTLDGGSQWFKTAKGRWSEAGILTMLIGADLPRGWGSLYLTSDLF